MTSPQRLVFVLTALVLSACSSSPLPKVAVAKTSMSVRNGSVIRNDKMSVALSLANDESQHLSQSATAYNEAVETFLMELQRKVTPHDWKRPLRVSGEQGVWEVSFDDRPLKQQGAGEYSPSFFDKIIPASAFELEGYRRRISGAGVGVPVVLALEKDLSEIRRDRAFRAGNGIYAASTVVLEFGKRSAANDATPVRVRLVSSTKVRHVNLAGARHDLAYDISSVIEANLGNQYIIKNGLAGLLHPDRRQSDLGLFGVDAYDPQKIPVVFVHGLNSSPRIWIHAVNDIYADPELSARYQPLLFIYPTGMSVPGAAARLRESLLLHRKHWDPDFNDANYDRMVIVGHSMGGLLSRLQVIDTGEELRKAFFTRPIKETSWLGAEQKQLLEKRLVLKPLPFIRRAIFIATPHRGSKIADVGLVQLAVRLIKLPGNAMEIVSSTLMAPERMEFLNPALLSYHSLGLRSVDMLSPGHPYFKALEQCPIKVPYHSIIGDRGKGPGPKCSDGVVPYSSSHLDGALSEKLVPHPHGCTMQPETVEEILRILRVHLRAS